MDTKALQNGYQGYPPNAPTRFDLKETFFLFLRNWYWLALGLLIGLAAAWVHLRYTIPIYRAQGSILIEDSETSSFSEENIIQDLGYVDRSTVANELQVLKSRTLMEKVVDSLSINISYFREGRIKTTELYESTPIELVKYYPKDKACGQTLRIITLDSKNFKLVRNEGDTLLCQYGTPFTYRQAAFIIQHNYSLGTEVPINIKVEWPKGTATRYANKIGLYKIPTTNVISVSLVDPVPQKAVHIINKLIEVYNQSVIDQKNEAGRKTLEFISERLKFVTDELYLVEREVETYKRNRDIPIDLSTKALQYLEEAGKQDELLIDLELRRKLLGRIQAFFEADSAGMVTVPMVSDDMLNNTLSELILQYNTQITELEKLLVSATTDNPVVRQKISQVENLRESILLSVETILQDLDERKDRIENRLAPIVNQIDAVPTNERELLQIMRQQQIKQTLFLYLLEKQEETALTLAAQVSNSRTIDPATVQGLVSPNRKRIYLISVLLGLAIPAVLILLFDQFSTKIYTEKDIRSQTSTPFLGVIGKPSGNEQIVIERNSRTPIAEMFRLLRTNLQFVAAGREKHRILITSCVSGEGKSFITLNLGISHALSGKRTVVVGLDLRKPKLSQYITRGPEPEGITNYLVGDYAIEALIRPSGLDENLFYVGSGPIPPNPAELLMSQKLAELFEYLQEHFDVILIDTAPVGLVTDALLLKDYADSTLFVVRYGKTVRGAIKVIDDIYRNRKLPRPGIILNGVHRKGKGGYGYGYGYGFRAGYGKGYYSEEKSKKTWQLWK